MTIPSHLSTPVIIKAERFLGCIPDACSLLDDARILMKEDGSELLVTTPQGIRRATRGEWILQDSQQDLYVCSTIASVIR